MSNAHPGRVLAQELVPPDGSGDMLTALPLSQSEIDELLYGDDRPAGERIERLQELAGQLRDQQTGDFGDNDPGALLREIDAAIARLSDGFDRDLDVAFDEPTMDDDPLDHRETLAPDSDELEEIEEDDEASLSDGSEPRDDNALNPEAWSSGDAAEVERGVKRRD
jgi:hypothetical protein